MSLPIYCVCCPEEYDRFGSRIYKSCCIQTHKESKHQEFIKKSMQFKAFFESKGLVMADIIKISGYSPSTVKSTFSINNKNILGRQHTLYFIELKVNAFLMDQSTKQL